MKNVTAMATYWVRQTILEIVLVALCVFLAFRADGFLSVENFLNILRNVSLPGIIAFGMTMVIIAGEIDLSVGSTVAFSGCLTVWMMTKMTGWPDYPHALLAFAATVGTVLLACTVAGCFTGFMRIRFQVPTFISTLAWMTFLRGLAGVIINGFPVSTVGEKPPLPPWFSFLGKGHVAGIPFPVIVFAAVFLLLLFCMNYTTFGRSVYAVGGNPEASRLSGINVSFIRMAVMAIVSSLAGIAGIMQASLLSQGSHTTGTGWELDIIAAVIIGGTSFTGGVGRIWGTLVGVIFLGVVENGMTMMEINNEYWQLAVRGVLIFVAVLLNVAMPAKRR